MKIAFWIKSNERKINLDECQFGNPGLGGTQYEIGIVSTLLKLRYPNLDITLYTDNQRIISEIIDLVYVKSIYEMIDLIERKHEILIFTQTDVNKNFYCRIKEKDINAIAWVHNYLLYEEYKFITELSQIKKVIFVGQQLYDYYCDSNIIKKSLIINNCIPSSYKMRTNADTKKVVYSGALIKQKGFHILAKAWKNILKAVPDAELYVLGGGLYGNEKDLSAYQDYCNCFLKDSDGNLMSSVKYMGTMGNEKEEFYNSIRVGVSNPTGKTETFCLSAVEFQAHGIPVVTYNGYGLIDTVDDKKTGYRIKGVKACEKAIIRLLCDNEVNEKLSRQAKKFVDSQFTPDIIIPQWYSLLKEKIELEEMVDLFSYDNYKDNFKWLRFLNRKVKELFKIERGISIQETWNYFKYKVKKIRNKT